MQSPSAASQDMQCFGLLVSVTMAQAILEAAGGTANPPKMCSGIKGDRDAGAAKHTVSRQRNDVREKSCCYHSSFRAYDLGKLLLLTILARKREWSAIEASQES